MTDEALCFGDLPLLKSRHLEEWCLYERKEPGRIWKICWIPWNHACRQVIAHLNWSHCYLKRNDNISGDMMIKSPAAPEILLKHFSSHCTAYPYKVFILQGTIHMCVFLTEIVIRGHNPSKPLSFDNWSYRPRLCFISIPNTSTALPYNKQSKQEWLFWYSPMTSWSLLRRAQNYGLFSFTYQNHL